ncbi:hypothetical protein PILCRDRAFT_789727 [Piloderma croceum F 1598]|uniref:RlpA-like protein double-psi beta-barrel domain-containing protein n=1 Tax=Piloderma croceum (strain F 1598) TaxID=765440 RepID=A0A0C3FKH5_PILCF|nr:hypothetical protein PILCRDRAFT_789727 [Piloderma croceum F 1598]
MFVRPIVIALFASSATLVKAQLTANATVYTPGLGVCGVYSSPSDYIIAVAAPIFDSYPNPICFKHIIANYQGRSVDAIIVDRCADCPGANLHFSSAAFSTLVDQSAGHIYGVQWNYE